MKTFAALALILFSADALCAAPAPIPPDESVAGIAQKDLATRWWQWGLSLPPDESPLTDRTGARCTAEQEGPVWFLAGVVGDAPAQRVCHIPAGKTLFFPVITYIVSTTDDASGCADMIRSARKVTDSAELFAELDGAPIGDLEKHRVSSANCFYAGEKRPGYPRIGPAAANGYWLAFAPLPKGRHKLHFGGTLPTLQQDITYTLIVE